MAWIWLGLAGLLEVVWAVALKHSEGLTRLGPSLVFIVAGVLSFVLLAQALRSIPLGTGYAVWTGIGAVGTAIYGIAFLGEATEALRLVSIVLIIAGIAGLKLATP
jgi:quaternary ammonium compound-resistance protein SugE